MLSERESDKGKIVHLEEENALLCQRLFGRKSEQTADPATPQMALFNEAERLTESVDETTGQTQASARRSSAHRSHPQTARTRADLRLRLP